VRLDRNQGGQGHAQETVYARRDCSTSAEGTVELDTGKGLAVLDSCRKLGLTEQTYDRWKQESGRLRVDQAKRLKGLEQEHLRLKRMVADPALDLSIVKEVAAGNF
jgi:hypothetical protein